MPNWIGDLILGISVALRKKMAEEVDLSLIVPERLYSLTALLCDLPIISYRRENCAEFFSTIQLVREQSFSKLYILPYSFSSALFGLFTRIPSRRGILAELRGWMLTERLPAVFASRTRHLTCEYSEVVETPYRNPEEWEGVAIDKTSEYNGAVVFCPGAAYGPAKQWPHFAQLAHLLGNKKIVIVGDSRDHSIGEWIAAGAPGRVVNHAGDTTLEQVAAILAAAAVVISNDSGLLHLAGFLGTPCVGIYGSTSSTWTRPLGRVVRIATGECRRAPCYERTCPEKNYNCLSGITAEKVAALANELLE
jgi:heptosyltransferase-2